MPIEQTKKQSDLEKRLKILRTQVYGKDEVSNIKYSVSREITNQNVASSDTQYIINNTDLNYLRQDLLKISVFASAAVALQLIIFAFSRNGIINLNFF